MITARHIGYFFFLSGLRKTPNTGNRKTEKSDVDSRSIEKMVQEINKKSNQIKSKNHV